MKRTLHKRVGLWELSVPLPAPVRGIWRYATFAEAWDHLWRTGYPPGLPSEIKLAAVWSAEPSRLGVHRLADVDDAAPNASDSPNDLPAAGIFVPQLTPAESSEVKRDPSEPLTFLGTPLSVPASSRPLMPDYEVLVSDAATVTESSPDDVSEPARATADPVRAAVLPWDEPKPAPHASPQISRAIAVGLASGLTILLVILFWPFSHRGPALPKTAEHRSAALPSVTDSTIPNEVPTTPKPAEAPVPLRVSGVGKSRASIQASDRTWITACADGKVVFSKLFTAGSKDSVDFTNHAVVRMGNAGPVEITVDGKPVGSLGRMGQVRVIQLTPGASHFLVGGEPDDCSLAR